MTQHIKFKGAIYTKAEPVDVRKQIFNAVQAAADLVLTRIHSYPEENRDEFQQHTVDGMEFVLLLLSLANNVIYSPQGAQSEHMEEELSRLRALARTG